MIKDCISEENERSWLETFSQPGVLPNKFQKLLDKSRRMGMAQTIIPFLFLKAKVIFLMNCGIRPHDIETCLREILTDFRKW